MIFNSFSFIGFLIIVLIMYYCKPLRRFQVYILIAASVFYYYYNAHKLTLILLTVVFSNVFFIYLMGRCDMKYRKIVTGMGVAINLAILAFFKYSLFFGKIFTAHIDASPGKFLLLIPLPLGISFYIFKGISLMVDSYRNQDGTGLNDTRSLYALSVKSLLYISFFPQIISGPIARADHFIPQIGTKSLSDIDWEYCVKLLILGFFLKMVIADNLKNYTLWLAYPQFNNFTSATLLVLVYAYSIQMFADFAGYSLISIAVASLFGYRVLDNFDFPYISRSFSEFWRRWHISLSSFLRDYLYIPLGGNKKGSIRTYVNLILVMFLGGLWHGAGWSYIFWGTFHGCALAVERFFKGKIKLPQTKIVHALQMMVVFILVSFAWLFFKFTDLSHIAYFFQTIYANTNMQYTDDKIIFLVTPLLYTIPVILYHGAYRYKESVLYQKTVQYQFIAYGIMMFLIITNSGTADAFIYFQF